MLKSLGVAAIFVMLQIAPLCPYAQGQPTDHPNTTQAHQKPKAPPVVINNVDNRVPCDKCNEKYAVTGHDPDKWVRRGFWINVGLMLVTLVIATTSFFQAKAANKQANHIVASERAWIITPPTNRSPELFAAGIGTVPLNVFDVDFRNAGKTPAQLLEYSLCYSSLTKAEWESLPSEPKYEWVPLGGLLLVPTDSIGERATLTPNGGILTQPELASVRIAERFLYAYGSVKYRDTFKKIREMRFGYLYYFPQGGRVSIETESFQRAGPEAYNRAT